MSNETISSALFDGLPQVEPEVANQVQANVEQAPTETLSATSLPQEAKEQTATAPTETPTYDPRAIFGEEYDSFDKVKSEMEQLRSQLQEWQSKEPEFANDDLRYINYALKAGFTEDQADTLKGVSTGQLTDPVEIVAAKLQLQYGWDLDRIENYLKRTYKLGEFYDEDDPDVQIARDQLEMQSVIDKDYLLEQANKIQVPQYMNPQDIISNQIEQWKPIIPQMLSSNSVLKLADNMDYKVPQETLQAAEKHVMEVLGYDYFDMQSEEQRKGIQDVIHKEIVYREFNNIVNYLNVENEKKAIRDKSNVPSPSGVKPTVSNTEVDNLRHILSQM
jgi:hypothetical protein